MLVVPPSIRTEIYGFCQAGYPQESCGLLFARDGVASRFVPMENQADRLHALDPESYPRTSRDYYAMNEAKVMRLVREAIAGGETWAAIVHSHIECGAYFSAEDIATAAPDGVCVHPDVAQIVVDVRSFGVVEARTFRWNGHAFIPVFTHPGTGGES